MDLNDKLLSISFMMTSMKGVKGTLVIQSSVLQETFMLKTFTSQTIPSILILSETATPNNRTSKHNH